MMYEMLSGQLPFDAEDAVEVAIKQISDQPKSLHEIAPQVPAALVEITEKAMAKLPQNRYASAREMLDALDTYVQNPSVMFEYQYITEDAPEKVVKRTMNQNKAARQNHPNESAAPRGKKAKRKHRSAFLPVLFGITIAFALACLALCWLILNDSSNLMNNKADITLNDYIGMTQEEAQATEQVASGQISVTWEQEYNSNYAAGYIYKQSPVSGRTVREGQGVTLTVSLGTQYVTVPDLTNYVQADAEEPGRFCAGDPGRGHLRGLRRRDPHRPGSRHPGRIRIHGGGLCQPPAGGHHYQGAVAVRHERGRCPHPAGAEPSGPGQPDRSVQRPAGGHGHRAEPGGRFHRQAKRPREHHRERRPGARAGGAGSTQRQRQRLVGQPVGR